MAKPPRPSTDKSQGEPARVLQLGRKTQPEERPIRTLEDFAKLVPALLAKEGVTPQPKEDPRPLAVVTSLAAMRSGAPQKGALKVKRPEDEAKSSSETHPFPGKRT